MRGIYLTEYKWRKIPKELRKKLLQKYRKDFFVDRYVANIKSELYNLRDFETIELLNEALDYLYD